MNNEIEYQYCYKKENCTVFGMSTLKESPSEKEIAERSFNDFEDSAIYWAYELLEFSPDNGKLQLDNSYIYCEGTLSEIQDKIDNCAKSTNQYYLNLAKALKRLIYFFNEYNNK